MGEPHVASINLTPTLHHFLTLPEIPNKSCCKMSNKKPLITYNKNMMMMSERYLVPLEQKLAIKEITIQEQNVQKEKLLASKCVKRVEKKHQHVLKTSSIGRKNNKEKV
jgi:hypothetical protein